MRWIDALRLSSAPRLALVGAGGKTTILFQIAREYPPPVLVTTTTHFAETQTALGDVHIILDHPQNVGSLAADMPSALIVFSGRPDGQGRLTGLDAETLAELRRFADERAVPLLIEADGARQLPLKAPAEHEPALPPFVDTVIVVAGLSALGKPLSPEWVHRPERFAQLTGLGIGEPITSEALGRALLHPQGGLRAIPPAARRICLLNQAETLELQAQAQALALQVPGKTGLLTSYHAVVIASAQQRRIAAVHEPAAGVILAAGGALRFGQPKQFLPWRGEPLLRHIARQALQAGLRPVIVVGGAYSEQMRQALFELDVFLVHNPDWEQGQSTSVIAGLRQLPAETGSALFLLADQPFVQAGLLRRLVEMHAETMAPIVAPLVAGQRATPVLFDRRTFGDLMQLEGDVGGRALFSRFPVTWLPWHDQRLLLDLDTPEDYQRLLELDDSASDVAK